MTSFQAQYLAAAGQAKQQAAATQQANARVRPRAVSALARPTGASRQASHPQRSALRPFSAAPTSGQRGAVKGRRDAVKAGCLSPAAAWRVSFGGNVLSIDSPALLSEGERAAREHAFAARVVRADRPVSAAPPRCSQCLPSDAARLLEQARWQLTSPAPGIAARRPFCPVRLEKRCGAEREVAWKERMHGEGVLASAAAVAKARPASAPAGKLRPFACRTCAASSRKIAATGHQGSRTFWKHGVHTCPTGASPVSTTSAAGQLRRCEYAAESAMFGQMASMMRTCWLDP